MTITYLMEGPTGTNSDSLQGSGGNKLALVTKTASGTASHAVPRSSTHTVFTWMTQSAVPQVADWPNGVYDFGIDINILDADLDIHGVLYRADTSATALETIFSSTNFGTVGVKVTGATVNPAPGAQTDRYLIEIIGTNLASHASSTASIICNDADSFIRGPWVGVSAGSNISFIFSDSFIFADTRQFNETKMLTQTVNWTEARQNNMTKMFSESVTFTDSVVFAFIKLLSLSDSFTFTDSTILTLGRLLGLSDTFTLADVKSFNLTKALTDAITVTDTRQNNLTKMLAQVITFTDSALFCRILAQAFTETINFTDNVIPLSSPPPTELVGYWPLIGTSDPEPDLSGNTNNGVLEGTNPSAGPPIGRFFRQLRNRMPTVVPAPVAGGVIQINLSETFSFQENRVNNSTKMFSEIFNVTDSTAITKTLLFVLSQAVSLTDDKQLNLTKMLNEAIAVTDDSALTKTILFILSENPSFTDSLSKNITKMFSESFNITDNVILTKTFLLALSENPTFTDALSKNITKMFSENVVFSDAVTLDIISGLVILLSETITMTDNVQKNLMKALTEAFSVQEDRAFNLTKMFTENVTVADTLAKVISKFLNLSQAITASDALQLIFSKNLTEAITVQDIKQFITTKAFSENITFTDTVLTQIVIAITIARVMTFLTQKGMIQTHDTLGMKNDLDNTALSKGDADSMEQDTDSLLWDHHEDT